MMNKSDIEWCDFTWNPVTGCKRGCPYCYARKQARRFSGDVRLNKMSAQMTHANGCFILDRPFKLSKNNAIAFPAGFEPTLHKYRLPMPAEKKKPENIFVCSMGDLFSPDIPTRWIVDVFDACEAAPWHNYLFLTKYPDRYYQLDHLALLPHADNFWFGTTITGERDIDRIGAIPRTVHNFVCIEPIHEAIEPDLLLAFQPIEWIIAGAETGNRKDKITPKRAWLEAIVDHARRQGIPIFLKDSAEMRAVWEDALLMELPEPLKREEILIPHCRECEQHSQRFWHTNKLRGDTYNHFCNAGGGSRAIPGRYLRTSPPWCKKRSGEIPSVPDSNGRPV